jgi:acetyltransferase-like isoleucine patch superfamily enzyme
MGLKARLDIGRGVMRALMSSRYGFKAVGFNSVVEGGCRIQNAGAMVIGRDVYIGRRSWLVAPARTAGAVAIRIGDGSALGEGATVSAVNEVIIGKSVLFGPRVWVSDHNHEYRDVRRPILEQGWTLGGRVEIEDHAWIGAGAVIVGARGLTVGRGSVVGANSVVLHDVPAFTVMAGNPARAVSRYDHVTGTWIRLQPESS